MAGVPLLPLGAAGFYSPAMTAMGHNAEHAPANKSPLSVERLRRAFSRMLGQQTREPAAKGVAEEGKSPRANAGKVSANDGTCPISPQSIVEAMLFVGRPDGRPLSARGMASAMRDVSPREVDAAVTALNEIYCRDGAPYAIVGEAGGYRLALRDEFRRVHDKFQRRQREARLAPSALEVLSIVAYHQPITLAAIDQVRGASSGSVLRGLVRRELVRLERPAERSSPPSYYTTARFLKLFGLGSLSELPRHSEMNAA